MSTITPEQHQAIAALLATMTLPKGLGTKESACSIAAINLALTGELTDDIPACMSVVIGKWIIGVQDAMPAEMRNSAEWKRLLPLAAGTGRQHEKERIEIIMDWMWSTVLPTVQPIADRDGFGQEWRIMLCKKTHSAAKAASAAADTASAAADTASAAADTVYYAATYAASASYVTSYATSAATSASYAATEATCHDSWQQFKPTCHDSWQQFKPTCHDSWQQFKATYHDSWQKFNPCGLLERLIAVSNI